MRVCALCCQASESSSFLQGARRGRNIHVKWEEKNVAEASLPGIDCIAPALDLQPCDYRTEADQCVAAITSP